MALARLNGVAVRGIVSALPARVEDTTDLAVRFGEDAARRLATATGIHARHRVAPDQCTSDLAVPAAQALLRGLGWPADSVDLLVFVSQTHDQVLPATACLVQRRLGLPKTAAAFDLSLGCSGYVYGLWAAGSALATLLPRADCRPARALLLVGDTTTRLLDPDDRAVAPLFGDAAAATALEIDPAAAAMTIDLGTDGAGAPYLMAAGGAMRAPDQLARLFMDGTQVFAFTLREVPAAIAATLAAAGWSPADVDRFVLHQANEMMIRRLGQKIGATEDKLVLALARHGNTSSASVPLALTDAMAGMLKAGPARVLLSGFGVGWSWATAAATLGPLAVCETLVLPP
ncbi:ketoacyl-ACP synthase III [Nitrospirillum sp. BR 11752]|uniref:ketoacyl-ACP synthase III n=1 Tax=Nitrospirillum sp. BR 11752 TaxID=3104293 RepID=UPI002EBB7486|nr:ketoacyl-ACP synthase III [Nitrospirillum sp. BR 11752]